ncbi:uncharacterized protein LOC111007775 [Momordica charantia]|uniref:Uncharacterized protein LOC111007775 n=1 Tax=Momordica charantia TaxID=3673 RepID=A0A6J1C467_MOMCH|nr:uncharacterized protein LOC111007775 [Momordica charantia]
MDRIKWTGLEELSVFLWAIWNARNQSMFTNGHGFLLVNMVDWVADYLQVYQSAQEGPSLPLLLDGRGGRVSAWCPPLAPFFKVNVDAAFKKGNFSAGLDILIRDSTVNVLLSAMCFITHVSDVTLAECLAAQEGVCLAIEAGLIPFQIETDSSQVFNLLRTDCEDESEIGVLASSIRHIVSSLHIGGGFSFVNREGNSGAHTLARMGMVSESFHVWVEEWLSDLSEVIAADRQAVVF